MGTVLDKRQKRLLPEPLGVLGMSVRTTNGLENVGLATVEDLLLACPHRRETCEAARNMKGGVCPCRRIFPLGSADRAEFEPTCYLLDVPNMGEKTLNEIRGCLADRGLKAS
jgi:DNA-directed RNA polymerase alpha subunit